MTESSAARGCARPIADIRAPRPLGKSGAPPRGRSHRRRPSGAPEPLESLGLPYQISSTIAVDVEPSYHALAWNRPSKWGRRAIPSAKAEWPRRGPKADEIAV